MAKSYDEKREAFDRLCDPRLEKATKAIELLANLARKSDYAWTEAKLQRMLDSLDDAVDLVAAAFRVEGVPMKPAPEETYRHEVNTPLPDVSWKALPEAAPVKIDQRAEVRWAYDALRRGDEELAKARLHLVIKAWIEEEKP